MHLDVLGRVDFKLKAVAKQVANPDPDPGSPCGVSLDGSPILCALHWIICPR
jgi:hypothetical protein